MLMLWIYVRSFWIIYAIISKKVRYLCLETTSPIEPNTGEVVLFTHRKKEVVKFLFKIHFQDMSFTLSKAFSTPEDSPTKITSLQKIQIPAITCHNRVNPKRTQRFIPNPINDSKSCTIF
jgi:hypothetical protein